jgi:alcohol dehydrogenase
MTGIRAAVLEGPERIAVHEFPVPDIGLDDGLLRVEMAGICGTDVKYYTALEPTPYPIILGHEILGTVERMGSRAANRHRVREGDRVLVEGSVPCWTCHWCLSGEYRFCPNKRGYGTQTSSADPPHLWGAIAESMYLAPGSILHVIEPEMPASVAMSAALLANAIEWLKRKGGVEIGDTVLIQGSGPQGLAAVVVARECGAGQIIVTGLRRDRARLELALRLGADTAIDAERESVVERVQELTDGRLVDVVLEVTGSPGAIVASSQLVRPMGTLVLAGQTGRDTVTPLKLDRLVLKEVRVQGVFIKGQVAYAKALALVRAKASQYPFEALISHTYPLEETERAILDASGDGPSDFVKAAILPHHATQRG